MFNAEHMKQSKNNIHSINPKPMHIASTKKQSTQHQPNNSAHTIRLPFGWFPWSENLYSSQHPTPPCHSARSRRRSRRNHISKITLALRKRDDRRRRWVRARQKHFPPPLIRPGGYLLPRERVFLRFLKCGFCNSGQALRAE